MLINQISVYLENNNGTLRLLTKTLAENGVDILALSIADTTNFGIIRLLVREADTDKALEALKAKGMMAKINRVLCIAVPNQPAGLDTVLSVIEQNDFSIEYMYSLNYIVGNKALLVLRLSSDALDKEGVAKKLVQDGVMVLSQGDVNRL